MQIAYEPSSDQVKVELLPDVPVAGTREVNGLLLSYAADRRIVGVEIRGARERIDRALKAEEGSLPTPATA